MIKLLITFVLRDLYEYIPEFIYNFWLAIQAKTRKEISKTQIPQRDPKTQVHHAIFLSDDDDFFALKKVPALPQSLTAPGATMASAGPREDEKIDDWVNQMDTILGALGQVVYMLQGSCSNVSMCVCVFLMSLLAKGVKIV